MLRTGIFTLAILVCISGLLLAAIEEHSFEGRTGIVLAFFGSTDKAAQALMDDFTAEVRTAHPDALVITAYSAARVRAALREKGKDAPSVAEALARMPDAGVRRAIVQSMHVMSGHEFHDMVRTVQAFTGLSKERRGGLGEVRVGLPLIDNAPGLAAVASALLEGVPERSKGEALLLVGHGTDHAGGLAYPALQYALWERDPLAFVTVLDNNKFKEPEVPSGDAVLKKLRLAGVKKIWLAPLLTVAGVHMKEDILGKDKGSWINRLHTAGFEVMAVPRGLLDNPAIRHIYREHLAEALKKY